MDPTQAFYMQSNPSTTQGHEKIPKEHHQHHSAPPPRPPGPPIRVNLKSNCLECQVKLKKKLQKISGVDDVNIVPEQGGTVTVSGSIDSKVLMGVIRNNYKKAKLLCPFDQSELPSKNNACKNLYCSEDESDDNGKDDPAHNFAVNNNPEDGADLSESKKEISEPKKEKKTKMCGILKCFGKESNPKPMPPAPPRPPTSAPARPPFMGIPAPGFFPGQPIRPVFRPGMPWMQPHVPPPQYGYPGRPPLPMSSGFPFPRSPPRSNPMVHYTSYSDNYLYPYQ